MAEAAALSKDNIATRHDSGSAPIQVARGAAISAVSRAMSVLEILSTQRGGLTVSEMVSALQIEKSVVSRILATLESSGHVTRDPKSNCYHVSLMFCGMALQRIDSTGLIEMCMPSLNRLAEASDELTQLALVEGQDLVYVAKADGSQRLRVLSLLGQRAPLHASSVGRVWLASLPIDQALDLAVRAGMQAFTPRTITTVDRLRTELKRVRGQGYSLILDEFLPGANSIAVPIRHSKESEVCGAVLISGPSTRMTQQRLLSFLPDLQLAAMELRDVGLVAARFKSRPTE